ncbi:MAG: hypothetical protein KDB88_14320 [Flavobacteriales bacterium]|nr:hypothetical protein [Flavobacteriales bacterium]
MVKVVSTLVAFFSSTLILGQLQWSPTTDPGVGTIEHLATGPTPGSLVTLQLGNPIRPFVSADGGNSWQMKNGLGTPNGAFAYDLQLHVTNTGTILIFAGFGNYYVWRSIDGGDTFAQLGTMQGIPDAFQQGFHSAQNGEVFLFGTGVLRSTDDGATWVQIVPPNVTLDAFTAAGGHFFAAHQGTMYRGNLNGTGFIPLSTAPYSTDPTLGLTMGINQRVIACGGSDRVIASSDEGLTWNSAQTGLPGSLSTVAHLAASTVQDHWVCGAAQEVHFKAAGSTVWVPATNGIIFQPGFPIVRMCSGPQGALYLHTYDGIYAADISTGLHVVSAMDLRLFPIPATDRLVVEHTGNMLGMWSVLDMSGRCVVHGRALTDRTDISVGHLEPGTYVLDLPDHGTVQRFVVIH